MIPVHERRVVIPVHERRVVIPVDKRRMVPVDEERMVSIDGRGAPHTVGLMTVLVVHRDLSLL